MCRLWKGRNKTNLSEHRNRKHNIKDEIENEIFGGNNNRTLIVGPCFCGKTYLMMIKIPSSELKNPNRKLKFLIRSPNRYPRYNTAEELSTIYEYKDCVVVFDDML